MKPNPVWEVQPIVVRICLWCQTFHGWGRSWAAGKTVLLPVSPPGVSVYLWAVICGAVESHGRTEPVVEVPSATWLQGGVGRPLRRGGCVGDDGRVSQLRGGGGQDWCKPCRCGWDVTTGRLRLLQQFALWRMQIVRYRNLIKLSTSYWFECLRISILQCSVP